VTTITSGSASESGLGRETEGGKMAFTIGRRTSLTARDFPFEEEGGR